MYTRESPELEIFKIVTGSVLMHKCLLPKKILINFSFLGFDEETFFLSSYCALLEEKGPYNIA